MPVEGKRYLEAQGVPAAQAAGCHFLGAYKDIPYLIYIGVVAVDFEAVFSGVACTADNDVVSVNIQFLEGIEFQVGYGDVQMLFDE